MKYLNRFEVSNGFYYRLDSFIENMYYMIVFVIFTAEMTFKYKLHQCGISGDAFVAMLYYNHA